LDIAASAPSIRRLEFVGLSVDPFAGIPDMVKLFYGLADYLSLWTSRYHFRVQDIMADDLGWMNDFILTFRVSERTWSRHALSPVRYDVRLPEGPNALKWRHGRVMEFLRRADWFYQIMCRVDNNVRTWGGKWGVNLETMEVATRWASNGRVVMKLIPSFIPPGTRRYMTHYRHDVL